MNEVLKGLAAIQKTCENKVSFLFLPHNLKEKPFFILKTFDVFRQKVF